MIEDKYWHIAWVHAAPIWTRCFSLSGVNPSIHSPPARLLHSLLFQSYRACQSRVAMDSTTAIQQNTSRTKKKKIISLICLRPPYLQVCLPRRLHLLACVTSCLSHYLPDCISVCPPASAPLTRPQRDFIFYLREKNRGGNNGLTAALPAILLGFYMLQNNIIPFIVLVVCFIFPLFHFSPLYPSVCSLPAPSCAPSLQAGRQEGWLRTAVPLPKLIASKDERPPLIALPGLLLSKQSTPHSLRKCVQLYGHSPWQWWNYSGVCSKYSSLLVNLLCVNLVCFLLSRVCSQPFLLRFPSSLKKGVHSSSESGF